MWLIPPSISSAFAAESACSMRELASQCPEAGLFVTLSGKAVPRPFSWRGWATRPWSQHLFGAATLKTSTSAHGLMPWIASLRDSPASPIAKPARARASKTSAGSGRPSPTLSGESSRPEMPLARYDRSVSSWRTSAASLPLETEEHSPKSWPIWPTWGSMRNGACYQRPRWVPAISVSESSSSASGSESARWTRPASADAWTAGLASTQQRPGSKHSVNLSQEVGMWPTPHGLAANHGPDGNEFSTAVRRWHTPMAADDGNKVTAATKDGLLPQVMRWATPQAHDQVMGKTPAQIAMMREKTGAGVSNLNEQASAWPTPVARDFRSEQGGGSSEEISDAAGSDALSICGTFAQGPAADWRGIPEHLYPAIESGVRMLVDGVAVVVDESRADQLRCIGNGVVPLEAAVAFRVLNSRLKGKLK